MKIHTGDTEGNERLTSTIGLLFRALSSDAQDV
jgi:hypothetical protein